MVKKLFSVPFRTFCWKTASKPDAISTEVTVSMLGSIIIINSRMDEAFLCKFGDEVFKISTRREMTADSSKDFL